MFWILESFSILQVGLDPGNKQRSASIWLTPTKSANLIERDRAIDTVLACQHPDGGFGGGPGNQRTFCRRMPLCVLWPLLGDPDQAEAGTKLIGMWQTSTAPPHIAD
jgi:hypothetical protein